MPKLKFKFPLQTDYELDQYMRAAFGLALPSVRVCPGHSTPLAAVSDVYFERSPVVVIKGSRGLAGKTHTLGGLAAAYASTKKGSATILGGSGEQSRRVLASSSGFWNHISAPRQLLASEVARTTTFKWGNTVASLTASQKSVRGAHPSLLIIDEADEVELALLNAALGQPMTVNGNKPQVVISSTHQYQQGTMTEILKRAAAEGWKTHEWCWKETLAPHGWLSLQDVELKKRQMTGEMWRVEVELGEPSIGNRAIDTMKLKQIFQKELGEVAGDENEYYEFEEPEPRGSYVTGVDWAKKVDWTIIDTWRIDVKPFRRVAWERCGRLPWPVMIGNLNRRAKRYRTNGDDTAARTWHDATGVGDVPNDYLEFDAEGVILSGRTRTDAFSAYVVALESLELVSPLIRFCEEEHRYATNEDLYGSGHPPDSFVAGAMCWAAARARVDSRNDAPAPPAPILIERSTPSWDIGGSTGYGSGTGFKPY